MKVTIGEQQDGSEETEQTGSDIAIKTNHYKSPPVTTIKLQQPLCIISTGCLIKKGEVGSRPICRP